MDPTLLLLRWAHILAAIVAMGGLVFARFGLVPALAEIDTATRDKIHEAIRRRWLPWVIGAITVLLASGLANFLLFNGRVKAEGWSGGFWMRQTSYHALFGAKFLLAMVAFYFASALVGRGQGTQWVRNDRAKWLSVTLGLLLAVVPTANSAVMGMTVLNKLKIAIVMGGQEHSFASPARATPRLSRRLSRHSDAPAVAVALAWLM